MSKKNNKPIYKLGDGSVPAIITARLTKKGKLKGKDKKEEKVLRGACVHHIINGKGRLKPTVSNNGRHECFCRICRQSFPTTPFDDAALSVVMDGIKSVNNQAKYMVAAVNGGRESERFFSEFGSMSEMYRDRYHKLVKIAKKADGVRHKSKHKKTSAQSSYGSWK